MKLMYSGFNEFNQWPEEISPANNFKNVDLISYLEINENVKQFDWSIEWAYNVFIINSKIVIYGFLGGDKRSEILSCPPDTTFTNLSCNDKYVLFYNTAEKYVWKYLIDPDVEEKWVILPNFIDTVKKIVDNEDNLKESVSKIVCGVLINIALSSGGKVYNIPSEIGIESITGKVIDVCCGHEHAVLLTDQGNVYTWGGGSRCQLGHGSIDSLDQPQLVEALAGVEIVKIAAGGWHSCAISSFGDLYTWGWNDRGQLGIYSEDDFNDQDATDSKNEPKDNTLADENLFFMDDNDKFTCDQNTSNDMSNDNNNSSNLSQDTDISQISSNASFKSCKRSQTNISKNDFECDKRKRLENSKETLISYSSYAIPNLIDIYDSSNRKILEFNVLEVSCGSKHTVVKLDDGTIWGAGCNKYGQLGFNVETVENVTSFTMLNIAAKNCIVKCGIWATSILSAD